MDFSTLKLKNCSNKNCEQSNPQPISAFGKNKNHKDGSQYYCLICYKDMREKSRKAKPEELRISREKWEKNNVEKRRTINSIWLKANPEKGAAKTAKRSAAKIQRTPPWLTQEHYQQIQEFYSSCKEFQWLSDPNDPLTVDHIVPLRGKNVSGLHVPWNLQILPRSLNSSKWNKF